MAYRTVTDDNGDQFRFHFFTNSDGDDVARIEYKRNGFTEFKLLYEGIIRFVIPEFFPERPPEVTG